MVVVFDVLYYFVYAVLIAVKLRNWNASKWLLFVWTFILPPLLTAAAAVATAATAAVPSNNAVNDTAI